MGWDVEQVGKNITTKKYAIEQAQRIIKQNGRLNGEPYKGEYPIFTEAQRQKILKQFEQVVIA